MIRNGRKKSFLWFFLWLSLPFFALAQESPIKDYRQIKTFLERFRDWLAGIFWIVAVIMIFYAAFLFITQGGDAEKVDKAKRQLLYAVIAIVVAIMATGFEPLVRSFLSSGN